MQPPRSCRRFAVSEADAPVIPAAPTMLPPAKQKASPPAKANEDAFLLGYF